MKSKCLFFDRYRNNSIIICSLIIIILLSILFLIFLFSKFNFSTSYMGIVVKEDDFYVSMVVSDDDLRRIQKDILVVNKVKKDFSILSISDDYILSDNGPMRYIVLKFDFDDSEKIVNNVIELCFLHKSTIFSRLREMIL